MRRQLSETLQKAGAAESDLKKKLAHIEELENQLSSNAEIVAELRDSLSRKDDEMRAMEERYKRYLEKAKAVSASQKHNSKSSKSSFFFRKSSSSSMTCLSSPPSPPLTYTERKLDKTSGKSSASKSSVKSSTLPSEGSSNTEPPSPAKSSTLPAAAPSSSSAAAGSSTGSVGSAGTSGYFSSGASSSETLSLPPQKPEPKKPSLLPHLVSLYFRAMSNDS